MACLLREGVERGMLCTLPSWVASPKALLRAEGHHLGEPRVRGCPGLGSQRGQRCALVPMFFCSTHCGGKKLRRIIREKTSKTKANLLWCRGSSEFIALLYRAAMRGGVRGQLPALWSLLLAPCPMGIVNSSFSSSSNATEGGQSRELWRGHGGVFVVGVSSQIPATPAERGKQHGASAQRFGLGLRPSCQQSTRCVCTARGDRIHRSNTLPLYTCFSSVIAI